MCVYVCICERGAVSVVFICDIAPITVCWTAPGDMRSAAKAAAAGAEATRRMDSSAGRSNYVSADILSGTPDPGAVAVAAVFSYIATHCDSI